MTKTVDQILAPKPVARPRIYAYAIDDAASGSANGATQAQPRATPGKPHPKPHSALKGRTNRPAH